MSSKTSRITMLAAVAGVLLVLAAGCGDSGATPGATATAHTATGAGPSPAATATPQSSTGAGTSLPDIFMTFEGQRYRLVSVESSAAAVQGEAVLAGATEDIDIDHDGPVEVYRATGGDAVYTFQASGQELENRGVTLPDRCGRCGLRLDWAPVDAQGAE